MAGRKQIEVTEAMQQEAERLAALGLNEKQISEALGMAYSSFQTHKPHFREALKKGKAQLRERITSKLLERIDEGSETSIIFACKRLGLFQPSIDSPKAPKTVQEAVKELSHIYQATASGEVSETQGEKLALLAEKIIKAVEVGELEKRIEALEKEIQK